MLTYWVQRFAGRSTFPSDCCQKARRMRKVVQASGAWLTQLEKNSVGKALIRIILMYYGTLGLLKRPFRCKMIFSPEHKTWISLKAAADFVWVMPRLYSVADTDTNSWRPDSWAAIPVILLWRSAWNPPPRVHAQLVHCNVNCPQTSSRSHKNQAGTRT